MNPVAALTTAEVIIGWGLVGVGGLAILLAVAISTIEAARKAIGGAVAAEGVEPSATSLPWDKVLEVIGAILRELMGKTGGPTFFMGLILVAAGIFVLSDKI
jgi:hypothetical protein